MGFLQNIFVSSKERYLLSIITELKEDKKHLREQLQIKEDQIQILLNNIHYNQNGKKSSQNSPTDSEPLTNLEQKIYNYCNNHKGVNIKQISKALKLKETSLRVYFTKIRKKGYIITL